MTAVHAALAKRFPSPEWSSFFEVRDDAGFKSRRAADFVAMNTWPSRGLAIHGVEVKVSRSDWLRELKDPAKSGPVQRYCDYWWLAIDDEKVARRDEIPDTWGLLVLQGKVLRAVKDAPKLEASPLDRGFVAVLLRCATKGMVPQASVNEMVEERVRREAERPRDHIERELQDVKERHADLLKKVNEFERESGGIRVDGRWQYGAMGDMTKVGEAVRVLVSSSSPLNPDVVQIAKNQLELAAKGLGETLELFKQLRAAPPEPEAAE